MHTHRTECLPCALTWSYVTYTIICIFLLGFGGVSRSHMLVSCCCCCCCCHCYCLACFYCCFNRLVVPFPSSYSIQHTIPSSSCLLQPLVLHSALTLHFVYSFHSIRSVVHVYRNSTPSRYVSWLVSLSLCFFTVNTVECVYIVLIFFFIFQIYIFFVDRWVYAFSKTV